MKNREGIVFERTIDPTENPRAVCVFKSPVFIPSSTNRRVDSFAHLQHTHLAVTFARWNLLLPAAKKK